MEIAGLEGRPVVILDAVRGPSPIHDIDPRLRILTAAAFSVLLATASGWTAPVLGLVAAAVCCALARVPLRALAPRMIAVNAFAALLVLTVPFEAALEQQVSWLAPDATSMLDGLAQALQIGLRANAVVLGLAPLVSTIETVTLGHALEQLGAPKKLTRLLIFTVRYTEVLHAESLRTLRAVRARAFQPRLNLHTLRTLGNLVGMLLVRAFDRSERVMAAMKCRGFAGRFPQFHERRIHWGDWVFAGCAIAFHAALLAERLW